MTSGIRVRLKSGLAEFFSGRIEGPQRDSAAITDSMELTIPVQVEKLPEGVYLATSEALPGLVAQGSNEAETLEIAGDIARKILEARHERSEGPPFFRD